MTRKIKLISAMLVAVVMLTTGSKTIAQSMFWNEDFSTGTQYSVTLGAEGNDGISDYFQRTDGTNIDKSYANISGYFFAGQDIDDTGWSGSGSPSQLTWSGIDISGKTNLQFSGMFGEVLDGTGDIDNNDYLYLEYRIDSGSWDTLIAFRNDGSQYNTNFMEDTDLDGIGDGMLITNDTLNSFTKSVSGTGSLLDMRFTAAINSGDEDFAIDEFELSGVDTSSVNEPAAYPTTFIAAASDSTIIDVVWSDAMNTDGYLIKMSKDGYNTISAPTDGTEEADDTNFSDGTGVVNATQGTEFYSFDNLNPDTEYFFMIWPYNGAAGNINYKTDGTVPQDTAITHANTSSIEDHKQLISNPYVNNQQMLTFELNIQEDMIIKLFRINGQLIYTEELNGQKTSVEIPVGDINDRIIILSVEGQNSRSIYKIAH
ncbi:MAG: hypothetical protein K9H84_04325 [Bacteroidales bacterium]|nr:hypothetical protein [Bacteroidales bacterium]